MQCQVYDPAALQNSNTWHQIKLQLDVQHSTVSTSWHSVACSKHMALSSRVFTSWTFSFVSLVCRRASLSERLSLWCCYNDAVRVLLSQWRYYSGAAQRSAVQSNSRTSSVTGRELTPASRSRPRAVVRQVEGLTHCILRMCRRSRLSSP